MHFGNMRTTVLAATTILLAMTGRVQADYVNFAFLGAGISGAGVLTVTKNSADSNYTAISGTLSVFGDTNVFTASLFFNPNGTGVAQAPNALSGDYEPFDNQLLLTSTPLLDNYGLFFRSGNYDVFLAYSGNSYQYYDDYAPAGGYSLFNKSLSLFTVSAVQSGNPPVIPSAVPEPSSLALCGIAGLFGLGMAGRRRSSRVAA